MDLYRQISKVVDLKDYVDLTQDVEKKYKNVKIVLNMSTILCLKKIRSLEIEYFNKCDGSGAAFRLFEQMLNSPASKTWGLLGSEVIGLIQYWLDAVRKHLISHHLHWWMFLKQILIFIKELKEKDHSLSSMLVEQIAESMLDLATSGKPDVNQKYEILHSFNLFCAESSREIRLALKSQFEPYFIRLSTILATCGHLPSQLAALEALLRWLHPRQDPATRRDAATKWFQPHLYPRATVDDFLRRSWMNFFQDARDFLNCHNETHYLITSVMCRKLSVGKVVIIYGDESRQAWVDINTGSLSITVVLDPQLLEALGAKHAASCETFTIANDSVKLVRLYRNSNEVTISVETVEPPSIVPSNPRLFIAPHDVTLVISSRTNMPRVDQALRTVFQDRYEVSLNVNNISSLSPLRAQSKNSMDENTRFSHVNSVNVQRRKPRVGYAVSSRKFGSLKSPSTASTGSLAQLHDKLANLPRYEFTKELGSICAEPELSVVRELNESQISNSFESNSTLKLRPFAVWNFGAHVESNKSKSDGENTKSKLSEENIKEHNVKARRSSKGSQSDKYLRKSVMIDETDMSYLLSATIESEDNSVIDATIQRLPKDEEINNTDYLMKMLVEDALQPKTGGEKEGLSDSGINTEDGKKSQEANNQDSEIIENTQNTGPTTRTKTSADLRNITAKTLKNKVIHKSTSDESNTEAVNETLQSFVNVRKRNQRKKTVKKKETRKPDDATYDNNENEDFFCKQFAENQLGEGLLSPTLAKKINQSSSESSDEFLTKNIDDDFGKRNEEIPDLDIVECLNDIVDKVCSNFDKCSKYLNKQLPDADILIKAKNARLVQIPLQKKDSSTDEAKDKEKQIPFSNTKSKGKKTMKLKFTSRKKKPEPAQRSKLKLEPAKKMSTIPEDNNESEANKTSSPEPKNKTTPDTKNKITSDVKTKASISDTEKISTDKVETPHNRRKRKLYSPKDDQIQFDRSNIEDSSNKPDLAPSDIEDDIALAEFKKKKIVTPKPSTSGYKEIEKERKKYKRIRTRKSKNVESPPSPKTKRLDDVFEKLKDNIEIHENENITMVDKKSDKDVAIFNFTSDSEDEDFKQKKIEVQKRTSTTTIGSGTSVMSTRRGRAKKKDIDEKTPNKNAKPVKRKRTARRKIAKTETLRSSAKIKVDRSTDLIDEKMREAIPEELNTSFVAANINNHIKEPEPAIKPPELEVISDENAIIDVEDCKEKVMQEQKTSKKLDEKKTIQGTKKATRNVKNTGKNQKNTKMKDSTKDDDRTISPLPGLVVETEISRNEIEDSLTTNVVQKFQKIYKDGTDAFNDTITTQNMLSDNDKANSSLHMNITEEIDKIFEDDCSKNNKGPKTSDLQNKENSDVYILGDTINSDQESKISEAGSSKSNKRSKLRLKSKNKTDAIAKKDFTVKTPKNIKTYTEQINDSQKYKKSIKSHNDKINDEIICVDPETVPKSKVAKSRSESKEIEIINITGNSEINSERSFATDGITGHGDMNELPPNPKLLGENLSPREIQDMDSTIREYYIELSSKVSISKESSESRQNIEDKEERVTKKAMQRVEEEDSDSESRAGKSDERKRYKYREYDVETMLPSRRESEGLTQTSRNTPNVSITRLSSKELEKWLPTAKSAPESRAGKSDGRKRYKYREYDVEQMLPSRRESEVSSQTSTKTPNVSITRLSSKELAKWLPTAKSAPESSFESAETTKETLKRSAKTAKDISSKKIIPETSFETAENTNETTEISSKLIKTRKSQISPVNLDDFMPRIPRKDISKSNDDTVNTQDVEMSLKLDSIAKKYFLHPTHESSPVSRADKSEESTPRTATKRKTPVSKAVDVNRRKLDEEFRIETVDISKSKQSSNVEDWLENIPRTATRRKTPVPKAVDVKRRKLDEEFRIETVDISKSKQSSNVEDWLENMSTISRVDNVDASSEALQNLMEKLDTTLAEIHQNTTKNFINLFVEVQRKQVVRKEEQRKELEQMSQKIAEMLQQIAEMKERSEERDNDFSSWLKERAVELLRRDARQKRAMVALLREDVQAVADHLATKSKE